VKWTITASIRTKQRISTVYSPSHEIVARRHGRGEYAVDITPAAASQPGPFRLSYLLEDKGVTASLMAYPDPEVGGGYFLLLAGVPAEEAENKERAQKREVIIVLDRSGSMKGEKIEQARNAAISIVEGLEPGEYFNIIDYSDSIAMFADRAVAKDQKSTASARSYLQDIRADGGTNIHEALLTALRQKPAEGVLPMILFLTDGRPTVGNTSEIAIRDDAVRANTYKRRIFTFGVGYDVNAPLLDRIAESTRAASINILPNENVESAVSTVFKRLNGPVMSEPRLVCIDSNGRVNTRAVRELMPGVMPDIFEGDQLVALGQYKDAGELRFRLEGEHNGKPSAFEFQFRLDSATTRNSFVPRLWATRKIAMLVDQIRQSGAEAPSAEPRTPGNDPRTRELVEEIVRLSTHFGILTEYTAFLATQPGEHGAPARYSLGAATEAAGKNLQDRAVAGREGLGAVNQSMNIKGQAAQSCTNSNNEFLDANMNRVSFATVQQIHDRTLFLRGGCWIDARIMEKDQEAKPDRTVEFGTPAYFELAENLAAEGRPGIIAVQGDVYLLIKGERVLVKGAGKGEGK
jgi:Ca-activated chloride channel family protein